MGKLLALALLTASTSAFAISGGFQDQPDICGVKQIISVEVGEKDVNSAAIYDKSTEVLKNVNSEQCLSSAESIAKKVIFENKELLLSQEISKKHQYVIQLVLPDSEIVPLTFTSFEVVEILAGEGSEDAKRLMSVFGPNETDHLSLFRARRQAKLNAMLADYAINSGRMQ